VKTKWIVLLMILLAAAVAWFGYGRWLSMHPNGKTAAPGAEKQVLYYHCPMHPEYKSDKQGSCPICGMHLEPVYASDKTDGAGPGARLTPEQQQIYGITVGEAAFETLAQTIRAVGVVQPDETRIIRVHPRIEGWIEEVFADFTGQLIAKGQPLVTIYSPELLASQQEYMLALRARSAINASTLPGQQARGDSFVEAARRRLELWDLSPGEIQEITQGGRPKRAVTIYSPGAGYITARNAFPRQRVTPETEMYTLADLSRVWVMADIFESDAGFIRLGQAARLSLPYQPSRRYAARVHYIQPAVDPMTRTLKVRFEVENPRLDLKPGMYVNVDLGAGGGRGLFVPRDALLDTGLTKRVFVVHEGGHFEPREVETGREGNGKVEILRGLSAQERIVTSGVFLVDSETQLQAGRAGVHQHDQPAH